MMHWLDRWFSREKKQARKGTQVDSPTGVAPPGSSLLNMPRLPDLPAAQPLSLQIPLPGAAAWTDERLNRALREAHASTANATVEITSRTFERDDGEVPANGNMPSGQFRTPASGSLADFDPAAVLPSVITAKASWAHHVIHIVVTNRPMPADAMERALAPAHYLNEIKDRARQSSAVAMLYYTGREEDRHEQYTALAIVAAAMAKEGNVVAVLNESACTSVPTEVLLPDADDSIDLIRHLRALPLLALYCGFVQCEVEGLPGSWVRTQGGGLLGLPDLAMRCDTQLDVESAFSDLADILNYWREDPNRSHSAAGTVFDAGQDGLMRVRYPNLDEAVLRTEGELLIVEVEPASAAI